MEETWLVPLAVVVLLPLTLNVLFDACTGYLYRPLTELAAFFAIIGTYLGWQQNLVDGIVILDAILVAVSILANLYVIQSWFSSKERTQFLGRGDYRLLLVTSYLCALKSPIYAILALCNAGIIMSLLFLFLAMYKEILRVGGANIFFRSFSQRLLGLQVQSIYSTKSAPMGLAIVIAAALTLFGAIAQS